MKHYVYKIIDEKTNQYYIGVRSCKCEIEEDEYMGSYQCWKPTGNLIKKVLKIFNSRKEANIYEIEIIKKNIKNELNQNYHIPTVGFHMLNRKHTKETKEKQRQAKLKNPTKYWKGKTRKDMLGMNNPMYGGNFSKEMLENMSKAHIGKTHTDETKIKMAKSKYKKVKQFDLNGNLLNEFNSILEASKKTNTNKSSISSVCSGRYKTANNFKWEYK